jgi:hypothetical protein
MPDRVRDVIRIASCFGLQELRLHGLRGHLRNLPRGVEK